MIADASDVAGHDPGGSGDRAAQEPFDAALTEPALADLERAVAHALHTGDQGGLDVLGYGEISLVLRWSATARPVDVAAPERGASRPGLAVKRLPPFDTIDSANRYGALILEYVDAVRGCGVDVIPTRWRTTPTDGSPGRTSGYVVQPVLPPASLGPNVLRADASQTGALLGTILDAIDAVVGPRLGLDAQLSNWAWDGQRATYLDVTTPLLNTPDGATRLDLRLLTAPMPAAVRPLVRRAVAPGIVAAYHRPRDVVLDLLGNLLKDDLTDAVEVGLALAATRVRPALTRAEVDTFYAANSRLWEVLLRLRLADRWWQRRVRRRDYPFLLPGPIAR